MKFKKTANKLSSKNIDVSLFEKQVNNYRKSMRACLFEIHKARKELNKAMKNQTDSIREKIAEIKKSYKQIKDELRIMFKEMNQQYRGIHLS
jgi:chromosome segregation ATPase